MSEQSELIKQREIRFCHLHPEKNQACSALLLLSDAIGIIDITLVDELCLYITYDLRQLTLNSIETTLIKQGYHLDGQLLYRMKRALYSYSEDAQLANLGQPISTDKSTQVSINRYATNHHGCRDKRPEHWRKYL
ncbi:hypothetical protein MNBD_GAMMA07-1893 [hydrothermal vent metagenome]|uniref:Uncharacterized protein n=1 Tax=hydrothermal vent metagenome TaxID=652676 RepID=A0A3B0X8M3_9ZZZZ